MSELVTNMIRKTYDTVGPNNTAMAKELLIAFFQELNSCEKNFQQLWEDQQYTALAKALHKLAGACGYFGSIKLHDHLLHTEALARKNKIIELNNERQKLFDLLKETIEVEPIVLRTLDMVQF